MAATSDDRVPGYLGRILDSDGDPAGTCFQVASGVLVTAWHVLDAIGAAMADAAAGVDPLAGGKPFDAVVVRLDPVHDLAVLVSQIYLAECAGPLIGTDRVRLREPVSVTGHCVVSDVRKPRFLTALGRWACPVTWDDAVPVGRVTADAILPGMSGAPVIRDSDGAVAGMVSGRYNSADGWLAGTVWVTRTENLMPLLAGLADITIQEALPGHAIDMLSQMPLVPQVPGWVDRQELSEVVAALTGQRGGAVALTTGLVGAGGFGKTTLAAKACQSSEVRRWFRGGIVWVTVGRDISGPGLATLICEVIANAGGGGQPYSSPEQAGQALARQLASRDRDRTLLVVDDVWTAGQLEPFANAARTAGRLLITTRRPAVLAEAEVGAHRISVDAMTDPVARQLLTRGLAAMDAPQETELLRLTGRWPLLLNLVNRRLANDCSRGANISAAAAEASRRLRHGGPAALDVTDSGKRQTAVAATIGYSLETLEAVDQDRFLELGIFAEDAEIPIATVAVLWQGTCGMDQAAAESLCDRLDDLSLVTITWSGDLRVMVIHDVVRDFALTRLGADRRVATHAALIDAARSQVVPDRAASQLRRVEGIGAGTGTPWWLLPADAQYLWRYLTYHLKASDRTDELRDICSDLRFVIRQLQLSGPAAVETDLARASSQTVRRLRRAITQNTHMLSKTDTPNLMASVVTARLAGLNEVAAQLDAVRADLNVWTCSTGMALAGSALRSSDPLPS